MVRKNPLTERGPCAGCLKDGTKAQVKRPVVLDPDVDYTRLWHHVTYGCGTVVDMIEGYAEAGMPNMKVEIIEKLRDRLDCVIQNYKSVGEEDESIEALPTGAVSDILPEREEEPDDEGLSPGRDGVPGWG